MPLPLRDSQLATELADVLYDFLPGKPHPRASADLSFPGAVHAANLSTPWPGGSKRQALTALLSATLAHERQRFCALITEIVPRALVYRGKTTPLTRDEIRRVNDILLGLQFKIPELHNSGFLESLPQKTAPATATTEAQAAAPPRAVDALIRDLTALSDLKPVPRGTAFERFLNDVFAAFALAPRGSFTLRGEQIDGSFTLDGEVYLLEAKWEAKRTGNRDLAAFNDQVGARASWARGLFVSYAGFTDDGLAAFARGRSTRIICMDGFDLYHTLTRSLGLGDILRAKARRAVEATQAFVPVAELFPPA